MSNNQGSSLRLDCPHCGGRMKIRTSKQLTPLYRKVYFYCTEVESCGFRCSGDLEIITTLQPSMSPNPEIKNVPLDPAFLEALEAAKGQ